MIIVVLMGIILLLFKELDETVKTYDNNYKNTVEFKEEDSKPEEKSTELNKKTRVTYDEFFGTRIESS